MRGFAGPRRTVYGDEWTRTMEAQMRSLSVTHVMVIKGVWQHVRMPLTRLRAGRTRVKVPQGFVSTREAPQDSKETKEETFVVTEEL